MGSAEFEVLVRSRYSVRKFEERSLDRATIGRILEAGRLAPTAKNLQPQRILVLDEEGALAKLDACTKCRFGAPAALLVCYDKDVCWTRDRFDKKPSGEIDAAIVTTHMMLEAAALGVGTTWVMHFDPAIFTARSIRTRCRSDHGLPRAGRRAFAHACREKTDGNAGRIQPVLKKACGAVAPQAFFVRCSGTYGAAVPSACAGNVCGERQDDRLVVGVEEIGILFKREILRGGKIVRIQP